MPKVAKFRVNYAQVIPRLLLCRERFLSHPLPFFTLKYGHTDEQFGGWFPCARRLERFKVESEVLTEKLSSMFHMDFLVSASALIKVLGG